MLLALMPIWLTGACDRGLWTPDEPRVADVAWRMAQQRHWVLPELAGKPFLEEPPLAYWAAAEAVRVFGDSPAAMRAPNLLYALVTASALAALGFAMDGAVAAVIAALVAGTALTALRVSMWLAVDACLVAGCAVSLLGAYLGYRAVPGRGKLWGYTLMHAGAAIGFMAKSAVGWLVPGLTVLTLVAWERRWRELLRPELYAGLILQALVIGAWLAAVAQTPHGGQALRVMFWYNIVGRFVKIAAPAAYQYTTGHRNTLGKYLLQLPIYVLPWTALVVAAATRAWQRTRLAGPLGTRWRFAVAASLPLLVVLSLAATARDIYAAPALLGVSLLVGLWTAEAHRLPTSGAGAFRWTRVIVALLACVLALLPVTIAAGAFAAHTVRSPLAVALGELAAAAAILLTAVLTLKRAARAADRGQILHSFAWTYACYAAAFCIAALAVFPTIDRWQDLPALARSIHDDTSHDRLALLNPDETTVAMLDRGLRTRFVILDSRANPAREVVERWFAAQGPEARVLVLLPGHAPGELTPLLEQLHVWSAAGDGVAGRLQAAGVATVVRHFELPHGRRYALLAPPVTASAQRCGRAHRTSDGAENALGRHRRCEGIGSEDTTHCDSRDACSSIDGHAGASS